ncbi:sugar ABC transporter permease [Caldilinea sp.]|uniref:sugar ABC transporter permease n=1 Tax=Caldilinea sp. TaxID=2293560 RepID=UPI00260A3E0E|nr:sugar ABC transporter permease [uncultured Caldilinea sp.]
MSSASLSVRTKKVGSISRRRRIALLFRIALAIVMLIFALFPVVWIFSASINPSNSLVNQKLIPDNPSFVNYVNLFESRMFPFRTWMWNSLKIATITTVFGVIFTAMAAYAFSRFRFRGRRTLLQTILLIQVFPNFLNMVALFLILQQLGAYIPWLGLNTHGGLILLYLGGILGVNTWLAKGYFDSIPRDLDEAAIIDGASHWQTFWMVILPLVRPILAVIGLLIFIGTYSEFVLARVMLTRSENYTLAVGLSLFIADQFANRWGVFAAGALIGAIPIVVIFLALQRYLVSGLTAGSVKG